MRMLHGHMSLHCCLPAIMGRNCEKSMECSCPQGQKFNNYLCQLVLPRATKTHQRAMLITWNMGHRQNVILVEKFDCTHKGWHDSIRSVAVFTIKTVPKHHSVQHCLRTTPSGGRSDLELPPETDSFIPTHAGLQSTHVKKHAASRPSTLIFIFYSS
jgi:hypothetical protein